MKKDTSLYMYPCYYFYCSLLIRLAYNIVGM